MRAPAALAATLALALALAPPAARAQEAEAPGAAAAAPFGRRVLRDLGDLAARPAHLDARDWRALGLAALALGGTLALDDEIRDALQRNRSAAGDDVADAIRPLGHRVGPALLLGGLWTAGALADAPALAAIGSDGVEASLLSVVLLAPALKKAVGRARPVEERGSAAFDPFSEFQSFPSGEATQAFTIAAVVAAHTENPWVEGTAWGLAGAIGLGRVYADRHWASDVVAGALIGAGIGSWVARRHPVRRAGGGAAWVVVPVVGRGAYGVTAAVSF